MKELATLLAPEVLKRDCQMCLSALKFLIEALGEETLILPVGHVLQCQEVLPSPVRRMGEGGRSPDEGTFVARNTNIYIFIQEPSPALSGTLSHPASLSLRRTGEGEYCNDLLWRCNIGVLTTPMSEIVFDSG